MAVLLPGAVAVLEDAVVAVDLTPVVETADVETADVETADVETAEVDDGASPARTADQVTILPSGVSPSPLMVVPVR